MKQMLVQQVESLCSDQYIISNLANVTALIYDQLPDLNWVGFYFYQDNQLILGPFQGKVACTPLALTRGMCARCFNSKATVVIQDVHQEADHIACDSASASEMVTCIKKENHYLGVLDIDSPVINRFDVDTVALIEAITAVINDYLAKY